MHLTGTNIPIWGLLVCETGLKLKETKTTTSTEGKLMDVVGNTCKYVLAR